MISVIIPTYNRTQQLLDCLLFLDSQKYCPPFEVIVVARSPSQELYGICNDFRFVKLIEYNGLGNGPAKNHAAMFAKGEFLAFTDDDCLVGIDWLSKLEHTQQNSNADIVVGQCLPSDFANPYLIAHQGLIMYYLDKNPYWANTFPKQEPDWGMLIASKFDKVEVGTSMNMLIRKSTFECLGGFSKEFTNHYGDDYDFNFRWKIDSTIKAYYCKSAIINHNHSLTLKKLIKVSFRYGMGLEVCRKLAISYLNIIAEKEANSIGYVSYHHIFDVQVHPEFSEYKYIRNYIAWQSPLLDRCSTMCRWYASWLAMLAMLIKRLGSWYGRYNPEVSSKVYDDV
jgi:GT2 family glycosyltransferase